MAKSKSQVLFKNLEEMNQKLKKTQTLGKGLGRIGAVSSVVGGGILSGLNKAISGATDFQDKFADVKKVLNGFTNNEIKGVREGILDLSKVIPLPITELANITEAGAKMSLPKDMLMSFTETVGKATIALGGSAEQMGSDFGKIASLYGVSSNEEFQKIGDSITYLADRTEASGGNIINITKRIGATMSALQIPPHIASGIAAVVDQLSVSPEKGAASLNAMISNFAKIPKYKKLLEEEGETDFKKILEKIAGIKSSKRSSYITGLMDSGNAIKEETGFKKILEKITGIKSSKKSNFITGLMGSGNAIKGETDFKKILEKITGIKSSKKSNFITGLMGSGNAIKGETGFKKILEKITGIKSSKKSNFITGLMGSGNAIKGETGFKKILEKITGIKSSKKSNFITGLMDSGNAIKGEIGFKKILEKITGIKSSKKSNFITGLMGSGNAIKGETDFKKILEKITGIKSSKKSNFITGLMGSGNAIKGETGFKKILEKITGIKSSKKSNFITGLMGSGNAIKGETGFKKILEKITGIKSSKKSNFITGLMGSGNAIKGETGFKKILEKITGIKSSKRSNFITGLMGSGNAIKGETGFKKILEKITGIKSSKKSSYITGLMGSGNAIKGETGFKKILEKITGIKSSKKSSHITGLMGSGGDSNLLVAMTNNLDLYKDTLSKVSNKTALTGALQKTFGVQSNTLTNQMILLANAMERLSISFTPVLGVLDSLVKKMIGVVDIFTEFPKKNVGLAEFLFSIAGGLGVVLTSLSGLSAIISPLITIISALSVAFSTLTTVISVLSVAFNTLTWPISLVVLGIAGLAVASYYIYKNWKPIMAWFSDAWDGLIGKVMELWNTLKGLWDSFSGVLAILNIVGLAVYIYKNWKPIMAWFSDAWDKLVGKVMKLGDTLKGVWDSFSGVFTGSKNISQNNRIINSNELDVGKKSEAELKVDVNDNRTTVDVVKNEGVKTSYQNNGRSRAGQGMGYSYVGA